MALANLTIAPGLYTEETPRGATKRWKDGDHARWRNGLPEKIGGWVIVPLIGAIAVTYNDMGTFVSGTAGLILGHARDVHDWTSLDGQKWIAIGTEWKLYLVNNDTLYDITPIRASGMLGVDPFETTTGSALVRVAHIAHGAEANDFVTFDAATAVGGITIDGNYQVVSIDGADHYYIQHSQAATSSAVGGGAVVTYEYEIPVGFADEPATAGYGIAAYGTPGHLGGGYNEPRDNVNNSSAITQIRVWALDNWGEDLVANPRGGGIYTWDRTLLPTTRSTIIPNAPLENNWILVAQEVRILIAFGAETGGTQDEMLIRWSDQEDFTVWTPLFTNRAGDNRISQGSRIITALHTRGEIVVFTDIAAYSMRYIGGNDVFAFPLLGENVNIAGPNAMCEANGVVYFMGAKDFYIYDGVIRPLPCDVRTKVFEGLATDEAEKISASANELFQEIWWVYPSAAAVENDRYVCYNHKDNIWYFGSIDRTVMHELSSQFKKPYGVRSDGLLFKHETGLNDADESGTPISLDSFVESWDAESSDGENFTHVDKLIPDFKRMSGSATVTLKGRRYPQDPTQKIKGPYTFDGTTRQLSVRTRNRQIALRMDQLAQVNSDWRMGTWRMGGREHGKR